MGQGREANDRRYRAADEMETIDDETSAAATDFIKRQAQVNTPFFCWHNTTLIHFRTHVRAEQK